ncbi:MAG: hypothetical protein ACREQJ_08250 [Candidatus Binatia bacterium]
MNVSLWHFRGDELAGTGVFELDDLAVARAQFDELEATTAA